MNPPYPHNQLNLPISTNIHLTYSQKNLLQQYLQEICLKRKLSPAAFWREPQLLKILQSSTNPVQKGNELFKALLRLRYPLSHGKKETFALEAVSERTSKGVSELDSKKKLINRYFYGDGIVDLKEYVLSLLRTCPMDCAYCFLREIYAEPRMKIAPNFEKIKAEIETLRKEEKGILYLNAGENADSMIMDAEYDICSKCWEIIQPFPEIFIEFRTKTDKIGKLLKIKEHQQRIIASFSLAPEEDRKVFETNTATIQERIDAIQKLVDSGFLIGLRLEPILYTINFKEKYQKFLEYLFSCIPISSVHSISLGCLRLTRGLVKMLRQSHPEVMAEEWVLCEDKKYRYYRSIRMEIYPHLLKLLKDYFPNQEKIILSTEPPGVWEKSGLPIKTMPELCRGLSVAK